jgi:uncharacterized protein (DUF1800 family)
MTDLTNASADDWLDAQLDPATISDGACESVLRRWPPTGETPTKVRARYKDGNGWEAMMALRDVTIARALWSRRQLLEVMVDFWSNHLNITNPSDGVWDSRGHYDALIRANALGRFRELLVGAVLHPAMLTYLTNVDSTKDHPNENLGREVLELHTVGVGAGYTEAHVKASARILTGMTVDWQTGEFLYRADWHATGAVRVLGFAHSNTSPTGGVTVAKAYLSYLARHQKTALTIARKLVLRFVSDTPSQPLVERLADVYLDNDTEIAPVLHALFHSPEFRASARQKIRRPYEDVIATARAIGLRPPPGSGKDPLRALGWALDNLGNAPLSWSPPDGYPDVAGAWLAPGLSIQRWNTKLNLIAGWWPNGFTGQDTKLLLPSPLPRTHGALVDALAARVLFQEPPAALRTAVLRFLGVSAATPVTADSEAVTWRLPYIVALLLDSPTHVTR